MGVEGYWLYHVILYDGLNAEANAGNLQSVQASVRQRAGIEGKSIHFMTPLMSASKGGKQNAALFLIAHNADVNAHNESGSVLM